MKQMLNLILRAAMAFKIRCLEIELDDRREAMRLPMACDEYTDLFISHEKTAMELANARAYRDSLALPPGSRRTYRTA